MFGYACLCFGPLAWLCLLAFWSPLAWLTTRLWFGHPVPWHGCACVLIHERPLQVPCDCLTVSWSALPTSSHYGKHYAVFKENLHWTNINQRKLCSLWRHSITRYNVRSRNMCPTMRLPKITCLEKSMKYLVVYGGHCTAPTHHLLRIKIPANPLQRAGCCNLHSSYNIRLNSSGFHSKSNPKSWCSQSNPKLYPTHLFPTKVTFILPTSN